MRHLKKYQRLIVTFVVILLLLQFGIYPCLSMANTFANIIGAIGLLVICVWIILAFSGDGLIDKDELKALKKINSRSITIIRDVPQLVLANDLLCFQNKLTS